MKTSSVFEKATRPQLTKDVLARTKRRALRQRCWYGALNKLERGIVDLTIRCVEEVKSSRLQKTLAAILAKLVQALRPGYLDMVQRAGRPLAARISQLAQSWGNTRAVEWKDDGAFIRFLGVKALDSGMSRLAGFGR